MRLSVGIPLHNEQDVFKTLRIRVMAVLDALPGGPHELVLIDDGSNDDTAQLMTEAAAEDSRIRVVFLSRNFGHQAAMGAALDHATGDVLVLMDGDLQDEPEIIPQFVRLYLAGADVVYARRASRQESFVMRGFYASYYRIVDWLAEIPLPLDSGDFALLGPRVVTALRQLPEHQRYLRGLRTWVGFTQVGLDVQRRARAAGQTKYTPLKLLQLAIDGICSFSTLPLRLATYLGLIAIASALSFTLFTLYMRVAGNSVPTGFTAALLVNVFLSGVQLVFLGVIGEYLGRVYNETKRRPPYVVAKVVGGGR